jgi:hypothetical protein
MRVEVVMRSELGWDGLCIWAFEGDGVDGWAALMIPTHPTQRAGFLFFIF